ncbi:MULTISPECIES: YeiH family protein [Aeromicrobium]|uniref:YeiH family protein n=1 Tax=Aeromicrobium TaxID=2040 RepID=UPI002579ABB5|nr:MULTISPECIES: putative sulfate exporter family transporter [Aeromicrobium]
MALTLDARTSGYRLAPALVAAAIAAGVNLVFPLASPLLVALVLGVVVTNTPLARHRILHDQERLTKLLLRWGVVMLGIKLPIDAVFGIGLGGVAVVIGTVLITYYGTLAIGARLGLEPRFVTLMAAGFSICGAAAIAAVADTVRARQRDVALAVALVTVFGSIMIALVPWASHLIGLDEAQAAVWAGASIHEVAQVVAAGSVLGGGAVALATTVKLGRVAMLAPMSILVARRCTDEGSRKAPLLPWFVVGFIAAVALRSTGVLPESALTVAGVVTNVLLAAGMFGLGLGIRMRELWPVPARALVLATLSTAIAAGSSLALLTLLM